MPLHKLKAGMEKKKVTGKLPYEIDLWWDIKCVTEVFRDKMILPIYPTSSQLREIIPEANRLLGYLQGTMGLEGRGLSIVELRRLKRRMVTRLLLRIT